MAQDRIPEDLYRFILTSIPSVPFLEAMLLFKAAGGKNIATHGIAQRLYLSDAEAVKLVGSLLAARIIEPAADGSGTHRFAPFSDELARMLDRTAALYAWDLIEVTHIIHSKTGRKAQLLADAFKWRRDS